MKNNSHLKRFIARMDHFFRMELWEWKDEVRGIKFICFTLLRMALLVWEGRRSHLLFLRASALTYVTAMSIVPILAFVFALAKGFGVHHIFEPFLIKHMAESQEEIVKYVIGYIGNTSVKALGSIGFVMVLFSVIQTLGTIERTFNDIWGIRKHRQGFRKVADYMTILAICPLAVTFSLALTAAVSTSSAAQKLRLIGPFSHIFDWSFAIIPYVMLWLGFTFLYIFTPNTRIRPVSALIGGIFAGTVWQVSFWSYTHFQIGLARYNAIYSGFASLPFFLVWLYISWVIVLFGAEVVFIHQNLGLFKGYRSESEPSPSYQERLALRVMMVIAHQFYIGNSPWEKEKLSKALRVNPSILEEILSKLNERELLIELQKDGHSFIPGRSLERISMLDVVTAVYKGGNDPQESMGQAEEKILQDTWLKARKVFEETLGHINFQQLCRKVGDQYFQAS